MFRSLHRLSPRVKSRLRRAYRWGQVFLLGVVLGGLLFGFMLAGDIYEYQDSVDGVHLPEVDLVVCLAGGKGRIAAAADLWYRYWEQSVPENPPILYISGMGHEANWKVFSKQIRRGVLEVIRPDQVVLETESENTEENARWLMRYVKKQRLRRVLLMTSSYHMKRARWMFDQVFHANGVPLEIETLSVFTK
jgi:uncharacterized SAM-binding protein YcdF (DUF218 family)